MNLDYKLLSEQIETISKLLSKIATERGDTPEEEALLGLLQTCEALLLEVKKPRFLNAETMWGSK